MTARAVYLHVGHGKTGSSFLQSCLAMSIATLQGAKIHYPDLTNSFAAARAGRITAGNIHSGKMSLGDKVAELDAKLPSDHAILFSHEELFAFMMRWEAKPFLDLVASEAYTLHLLCFIRDPLDHAASLYQQTVKRSGNINTFSEYLDKYSVPNEVFRFVNKMQKAKGVTTIRNYTKHRNELVNVMESWLGLPIDTLNKPKKSTVNRSMTNGELALQMEFNKMFGPRAATLVSDPLCNNLPSIKSEKPAITSDALATFLTKMAGIVRKTNEVLPKGESYTIPNLNDALVQFPDPQNSKLYSFNKEQLSIVARRLSRIIKDRNC